MKHIHIKEHLFSKQWKYLVWQRDSRVATVVFFGGSDVPLYTPSLSQSLTK